MNKTVLNFLLIKSLKSSFLIKAMLLLGADINARNGAALRTAIYNKDVKIVKLLLKKGINIHPLDNYAIRFALSINAEEIIDNLLQYGVDLDNALEAEDSVISSFDVRDKLLELMHKKQN